MQRREPQLRLIVPEDYGWLYELVTVDGAFLDRFRGATPRPEEFINALWAGVLAQFVVEHRSRPIGLLSAINANAVEGTAGVRQVAKPDVADELHAGAMKAFLRELFTLVGLRKVYVEVPEYAIERFLRRGGSVFTREAWLSDHWYSKGSFWGWAIFGLERDAWERSQVRTKDAVPVVSHQTDVGRRGLSSRFAVRVDPGEVDASPIDVDVVLAGHAVRLRPVVVEDYKFLYQLANTPPVSLRWRFRGSTPSPEQFNARLWDGVLAQFVVERLRDNDRVGVIAAYNASFQDRFAYMSMLIKPASQRRVWPLEAGGLFLDYLFSAFNLRKVYGETIDFNYPQFQSHFADFFVEEGRLVRHSYHAGKYWDMRIDSVSREAWLTRQDTRFARFLRNRDARTPPARRSVMPEAPTSESQ
jgi:RimJ/RimL family protein N-acetyltransferase